MLSLPTYLLLKVTRIVVIDVVGVVVVVNAARQH